MATKIEWTEATWNPITGCSPVSAGCQNCYARRMAHRLRGRHGYPKDEPFRVTLHPDKLELPLRWKKPRMVFVCSMSDLFHMDVPDEFVAQCFTVMAKARRHTFQKLTKRPERMREMLLRYFPFGVPRNIWWGITCENQVTADERIPILRQCPAAVRWVSFEPLLEPVNVDLTGIDWIVIGCETGPGRRPCDNDWVRKLMAEAHSEHVAVFIKKLIIDGKPCGNMSKWPADLRVREYPRQHKGVRDAEQTNDSCLPSR